MTSLDIKINSVTELGVGLTIPAYRKDVQREADVIEEILRVYGYNNIGFTQKLNASISNIDKFADHSVQNTISNQFVGQGFHEMMSNSLTSPEYTSLSEQIKEENNITMLNPLSNDLAVMRQSMLFSGLEAIAYNNNRKRSNLKLFEFGKTYHQYEAERIENKHLSIFISGDRSKESWVTPSKPSDFFYLKGVVTSVLERLGLNRLKSSPVKNDIFAEGLSLSLGKTKLVDFGNIKKSALKHFSISQEVWYADFNWDAVLDFAKHNKIKFTEIPKFPEVRRDFALLLEESVKFEDIHTLAKQTEKQLLKDVDLFDVYQGENLPSGKKSYAVSFYLQDATKTLNDKQIDKVMDGLIRQFENQLGAIIRR